MGRFADLLDSDYALRPNDKNDKSPPSVVSVVTTKTTKVPFGRFGRLVVGRKQDSLAGALAALEARVPDYVEPSRWLQCVADGKRFLAEWGERAAALGWTADDLFGLHMPPAKPHPTYDRLSRYDATGLIWNLHGHRVVMLTADTAAIQNQTTGNILSYRKRNKPGLGPVGDSLDNLVV